MAKGKAKAARKRRRRGHHIAHAIKWWLRPTVVSLVTWVGTLASIAGLTPLIVASGAWLAGHGQQYADSRVTVDAARRAEVEIHATMLNWLHGTLAKDEAILAEYAPKQLDTSIERYLAEGAAWRNTHPESNRDFISSLAKDEAWLVAHPATK